MFLFFLCANKAKAQLNTSPVTSNYPGGYNISCHGATDGWIDILVEGGTPPYWFYWSNGSFNQNLDNLTAGNYTVVVSDMNNLVDSITVILYEPNQIDIQLEPRVYEGGYNISEAGQSNGKIECHVSGGVQDYSYLWNTNSTEYKIEDIPDGNYSVRVTDMNACSSTTSITLIEPSPLHITSLTSPLHHGYNLSCKNSEDGAINIAVAGGSGPYTFHWFNSSYSIGVQNPTGLKAGHYSVIVTDVNDISIGGQITLTEPIEFLVSSITPSVYPPQNKNLSCSTCSNGSLTANLTGGLGNKKYQWVDQSTNLSIGQTTQTASNLSAGTYLVTVTDTNGCIATGSHSIIAPDRDDWSMAGNAGTNPALNFIGTKDSTDLIFKTNNSERIKIKNEGTIIFNGLVKFDSISITKPLNLETLKINRIMAQEGDSIVHLGIGSINFNQNINNLEGSLSIVNGLYIRGLGFGNQSYSTGDNGFASGFYARAEGSRSHAIGYCVKATASNSIVMGSGLASAFLINNYQNSIMLGCNSSIPAIFISAAISSTTSGNVGIGGATTPGAKLQIDHNDQNGGMILNRLSSSTSHSEIKFNKSGTEQWAIGTDLGELGKDNLFFWNHTLQQSVMIFSNDGDPSVGIGINPADLINRIHSYKLYVEGGIAAREIKVTAGNFPDYVFHKGYSLMTIYELKKFIHKNKHLPDVPTSDEVNGENGFEVGKFQIILLKKVEEQALYIISLQEQIDAIKSELNKKLK